MICKHILSIIFFNEPELKFLHTVKWFQVFLSYKSNSICLYKVKCLQILLYDCNNSKFVIL